jgi:hypothetical protein
MERAVIPANNPGSTWQRAGVAAWSAGTRAIAAIREQIRIQLPEAEIIMSP